jgi:hypothetical protein
MLLFFILLFAILNNAFIGSIGQNRLKVKQCGTFRLLVLTIVKDVGPIHLYLCSHIKSIVNASLIKLINRLIIVVDGLDKVVKDNWAILNRE